MKYSRLVVGLFAVGMMAGALSAEERIFQVSPEGFLRSISKPGDPSR
jgi:hypothetical protein